MHSDDDWYYTNSDLIQYDSWMSDSSIISKGELDNYSEILSGRIAIIVYCVIAFLFILAVVCRYYCYRRITRSVNYREDDDDFWNNYV